MSHFRRWPWPRVLAHRGAGTLAPENTLAALRFGHALGFRAVEFDATAPRDDVPVLMHDATLERTTNGAGALGECTAAQLARLDAGRWHSPEFAGEPVPSLAAVLQVCRAQSIWPNVEIKPVPGQEARTGAVVARAVALAYADLLGRSHDDQDLARLPLLSSFAEASLAAARDAAPALPRALLVDEVPDDWRERLQRHCALSLNTNHRHLTQAAAAAVKEAGYWLFCYTVNERQRASTLLGWGVDAFCTDRIDLIGADFGAGAGADAESG
jgi:glycerophosphoryl diester phosphodiesterase